MSTSLVGSKCWEGVPCRVGRCLTMFCFELRMALLGACLCIKVKVTIRATCTVGHSCGAHLCSLSCFCLVDQLLAWIPL